MSDYDVPTPSAPAPCYLHPDRPALLRCSRCERPICGADAIEAPVGYQCPECASGAIPARTLRSIATTPRVTQILVGIIAAIFVLTQIDQSGTFLNFGLRPIDVGQGQWWRLITSGFLHAGIVHVAFNGILLWRLGEMLESALGHGRFLALFALGLAGGGLGVMGLSWMTVATPIAGIPVIGAIIATSPAGITVGASGAVFGLMGAAVVGMRNRGINPWRTDIGTLVLLNLVITVVFSSFISVGGHVGGLLAGMLGGRLVLVARDQSRRAAIVTWIVAVGVFVAAGMLGVAGNAAILALFGQ
ncbi:MAG: rhomboid family intramembrane serine protease [Nitriliruptoraceae bacterium]